MASALAQALLRGTTHSTLARFGHASTVAVGARMSTSAAPPSVSVVKTESEWRAQLTPLEVGSRKK